MANFLQKLSIRENKTSAKEFKNVGSAEKSHYFEKNSIFSESQNKVHRKKIL